MRLPGMACRAANGEQNVLPSVCFIYRWHALRPVRQVLAEDQLAVSLFSA